MFNKCRLFASRTLLIFLPYLCLHTNRCFKYVIILTKPLLHGCFCVCAHVVGCRMYSGLARNFDYHFITSPSKGILSFVLWRLSNSSPINSNIPRRDLVALRRELDDLRRLVDNLKEFRPPTSNQALAAVAAGEEIANALYQQHGTKFKSFCCTYLL